MIRKEEFLSIVKSNSRIYLAETEEIWDLSISDQVGLDSITIVSILVEIEHKCQVRFSFEKLKKIDAKTLRDLWEVISSEE